LSRTFSALRYRDFRLLWIGAFLSTTGTWMQTIAQGWLVLDMTGSAFLLGVDGFLATGPMIIFSLFGGVIADRVERRKIMLFSQYLQMTFALILAALIWGGTVKVWHIFLLSFLTGSAQSFSGPAYISLLPLLVKREDVPNAIAMNSMQFNLARVIGPIFAGAALVAWGPAICFTVNGLSFFAVIVALLLIRSPGPKATDESKGVFDDMKEGFRFVTSRPKLLTLTFLAFAGTFLGMPIITFLPVVAKSIFGLKANGYAWMMTTYGLGSVTGALFVAATVHAARKGTDGAHAAARVRVAADRLRVFTLAAALAGDRLLRRRVHRRRDRALQLARAAHGERRHARPRDVDLHARLPRRHAARQPARGIRRAALVDHRGAGNQRRRARVRRALLHRATNKARLDGAPEPALSEAEVSSPAGPAASRRRPGERAPGRRPASRRDAGAPCTRRCRPP
jgi:MFS family permease